MKPHLKGIIKEPKSEIGSEESSGGSFGPFIAGIVLGITGTIFTMTMVIKSKPLSQKELHEKMNKYITDPSKGGTVIMRSI